MLIVVVDAPHFSYPFQLPIAVEHRDRWLCIPGCNRMGRQHSSHTWIELREKVVWIILQVVHQIGNNLFWLWHSVLLDQHRIAFGIRRIEAVHLEWWWHLERMIALCSLRIHRVRVGNGNQLPIPVGHSEKLMCFAINFVYIFFYSSFSITFTFTNSQQPFQIITLLIVMRMDCLLAINGILTITNEFVRYSFFVLWKYLLNKN